MDSLTVYEVLGLASQMLRKDSLSYDFLVGYMEGPTDVPSGNYNTLDITSYEYKLMMTSINNVYDDLITQYSLFCFSQDFTASSINYSDFTFPLVKIIEIKDSKGKKVRYYRSSDKILLPKMDTYTIIYTYRPEKLTENVTLSVYPFISESTLAYGVCSQYCLMDGLFDEADMWEAKYKESLLATFRQTKNIKMKAKIWQ